MTDLVVRELETGKEVHRVNVDGQSKRGIERVMMGMLRNMSERYYIDDSETEAEESNG